MLKARVLIHVHHTQSARTQPSTPAGTLPSVEQHHVLGIRPVVQPPEGLFALVLKEPVEGPLSPTIEAMRQVKDDVKVLVGGAPVTDSFAKEIGADGYAPDASRAVDVVKELSGIA